MKVQKYYNNMIDEEFHFFVARDGKSVTKINLLYYVQTQKKADAVGEIDFSEPCEFRSLEYREHISVLIRGAMDKLLKDNYGVWSNMNHLPMRFDVFKAGVDSEKKPIYFINEYGLFPEENSFLSDNQSHSHYLQNIVDEVSMFIKENYGNGM